MFSKEKRAGRSSWVPSSASTRAMLSLIDRVGVEVQVGVVDFVVIEGLKFWNHIDTTNIFELAILYR